MDKPDLPTMIVEGPFSSAYAMGTSSERRWIVSATFTTEAEAHGFAAWVQSDHPTFAGPPGGPRVIWRDVENLVADSGMLPPPGLDLKLEHIATLRNPGDGRDEVIIYYRVVGASDGP